MVIKKRLDIGMVRVGQRGAEPGRAQVGIQDIVFKGLLLVRIQCLKRAPVAAFDGRVNLFEKLPLGFGKRVCKDKRAAHEEQHACKQFASCVSRQRHRQKQEPGRPMILTYLQHQLTVVPLHQQEQNPVGAGHLAELLNVANRPPIDGRNDVALQ